MPRFNLLSLVLEGGMLISGALLTTSKKAQNECHAPGWGGTTHKFNHPYIQTSFMFLGEAACLLALVFRRNLEDRRARKLSVPTVQRARVFQAVLLIPALLDLVGTTSTGIGLVYLDASLYQMLRGSSVVFASVFGWLFLHRSMLPFRWVAIATLISGLGFVGASGLLTAATGNSLSSATSSSSTSNETPIELVVTGVVMVLTGQMITGVQVVVEESLLRQQRFEPLHVVGFEGVLGFVAMSFVVLPVLFFVPGSQPSPLHYNVQENALDALLQIFRNPLLLLAVCLYIASAMLFSLLGLYVTRQLTCVHRTIIDSLRTVLVWAFELLIGLATHGAYGELWTRYSWVRVVGFLLLLLGAFIFNGVIRLPGFVYDTPEITAPTVKDDTKPLLINPSTSSSSSGRWDEV